MLGTYSCDAEVGRWDISSSLGSNKPKVKQFGAFGGN